MKFKHDKDRREWQAMCAYLDGMDIDSRYQYLLRFDKRAMRKLRDTIAAYDAVSIAIGFGEIVITSLLRIGDQKYHGIFQAADIRSNDKPVLFIWAMERLASILRDIDGEIQMDPHKKLHDAKDPNRHLHVEVDTGVIHA